jgi:hypothetical protein
VEIQSKYDGNKRKPALPLQRKGRLREIIVSIPITFKITPAAAGRRNTVEIDRASPVK